LQTSTEGDHVHSVLWVGVVLDREHMGPSVEHFERDCRLPRVALDQQHPLWRRSTASRRIEANGVLVRAEQLAQLLQHLALAPRHCCGARGGS
jgi:hypothetical protein